MKPFVPPFLVPTDKKPFRCSKVGDGKKHAARMGHCMPERPIRSSAIQDVARQMKLWFMACTTQLVCPTPVLHRLPHAFRLRLTGKHLSGVARPVQKLLPKQKATDDGFTMAAALNRIVAIRIRFWGLTLIFHQTYWNAKIARPVPFPMNQAAHAFRVPTVPSQTAKVMRVKHVPTALFPIKTARLAYKSVFTNNAF